MGNLARLYADSQLAPITVDWKLVCSQPAIVKGLAYWKSLCNGRAMPSRRDLSPRAMRDFLTHVSVVDVVPDPTHSLDYVVSLQGQHALDVLGHVAGRRLREILPSHLHRRWHESFELSRAAAAPVRLLTRASTRDKNWLACEALIAPLGDGTVQALFWVFAAWRAK